eukprot:scaffold12980_cov27-Tisochrysis_lutea.AAC.2
MAPKRMSRASARAAAWRVELPSAAPGASSPPLCAPLSPPPPVTLRPPPASERSCPPSAALREPGSPLAVAGCHAAPLADETRPAALTRLTLVDRCASLAAVARRRECSYVPNTSRSALGNTCDEGRPGKG